MRRFFIIILTALVCLPAAAVLKEKDLASTLSVLRAELQNSYQEQQQTMKRFDKRLLAQHASMVQLMQRSDQTSLMLYSQKQDFTFDMTYACHEATDQYREFSKQRMPYDKILSHITSEEKRYANLIASLKALPPRLDVPKAALPRPAADSLKMMPMPKPVSAAKSTSQPFVLDSVGIADREACLKYAEAIHKSLTQLKQRIEADNEHYKMVGEKLKKVNDYAVQRYSTIQNNIFVNGDENYFALLASLPVSIDNAKTDFKEKYDTEKVETGDGKTHVVHSQWRGPIVFGLTTFVLFYIVIASLLSNVLIRWLLPKRFRTEEFMKKKVCIMLAVAMIIFAVSIMIARTFMTHNFFLMASRLLIEYAWLLGAIFVSLLIRLPGEQIKSGFRIYSPIMLMSFIVIAFRIIFIPNNIVALVFPPVLLLFTLWQWSVIRRHNNNIPRNDIFYTYVSLTLMIFSTVAAWYGYTLLAVQMLIWWTFQLTCIQSITCAYDLLAVYKQRYLEKRIERANVAVGGSKKQKALAKKASSVFDGHSENINVTWFYDLISMVVVPVLGVFSVLLSIWWASDVFDLTATVMSVFMTNYINVPGIVQLSLAKVALVTSLFFVFRYLNYLIRAVYHRYRKPKSMVNGKPNFTLANNVIAICVWGAYAIISIKMLKIPSTAISVISAGLATGVGFAMKDTLNNFFYGISLMTGRVRVGDFIECDGVRGKVESITYQSTQIATADGCVIAFLNSSLFSKNFKNITKNHSYELVSIPVGVAYGANIAEVRQMLIEAVQGQMQKNRDGRDLIHTKKPISVVLNNFGDSSVDLLVNCWILVEDKFAVSCRVREAVYNVLNKNNIEIPFPQRDLHVYNVSQSQTNEEKVKK